MLADPRNGEDFDLPACARTQTYVIASVPRCGSTLLARALWDAGRVGAPKEYLNPMQIRDWEVRFGSRLSRRLHGLLRGPAVALAGQRAWTDERLASHVNRVRRRRSSGGWFGLKIHWHHFESIFVEPGRDLFPFLGDISWIRIRREDRLMQAISWARALQTGVWVADPRIQVPPIYNRRMISGRLREIEAAEAGWDSVLSGQHVHEVRFVDITQNLQRTTQSVLAHLGKPGPVSVSAALSSQSDSISVDWAARYRAGN